MKIGVVKAFIDKSTGEPYNRGDIFESSDKARVKELKVGGYLADIAKADKPQKQNSDENATDETEETKTTATE